MSSEKQTGKIKKVAKIVVAYLVAAWTFLQFVDWTLIRYNISPYWVDILLWFFVGVLPSLVIYLFNSERINNKKLKLWEKIIFPSNILVLGVFLFLFFGSSDLGSTTKEVSFTNELGKLETQTITKEEFRIGIPIFNFQQKKKDTINKWLSYGINKLIKLDLDQDKNLSPSTSYANNTTDKVKISKIFDKYYVDGDYEVSNNTFTITTVIRNSKNGSEITRKTLSGKDLFSIIDQISVFVKSNVGLIGEMTNQYIDLDIKDITTNSIEALEYWVNGDYEKAVKIDNNFALAYLYNAARRNRYSQGELEEKFLIDKAYQNKSKLPSQLQFEILMYKHIIYERWDDAKELIKYQLEFEPNNETYNFLLNIVYSETEDIEAFYKHSFERFTKNKNEETAKNYFLALIFKEEYDKALSLVKTFELLAPNIEDVQLVKAYTYISMGDYEMAKKTFKKIDVIWPKETTYKNEAVKYINKKNKNEEIELNPNIYNSVFRSTISEQKIKYFKKNNTLFVRYNNQILMKSFANAKDELLILHLGAHSGLKQFFEKDNNGNIFRVKSEQFNQNNSSVFYYYLEPGEIKEAYLSLNKKELKGLDKKFKALIKKYPNHWFLKDALQHLNYISKTNKETLKKQMLSIVGEYGTRKFWVENDKLYYKRDKLPKAEILPISKDRYINTSKYTTNYGFEFLKGGKTASMVWSYKTDKNLWEKDTTKTNYLLKN